MAWTKGTIKLAAAKRIFSQFEIQEEKLPGTDAVVGYSAKIGKHGTLTDISLTSLCERLVAVLHETYMQRLEEAKQPEPN